MYEQMLDTYQLSCHVYKTICKCKKLMDHISSNISKNKILHSEILPSSHYQMIVQLDTATS